ncbi:hypothetical protein FJZ31_09145 [Candidatus Poribacteria bacterium]|nr:hypothetical protein [Candidatus Poribacteria bacterium]
MTTVTSELPEEKEMFLEKKAEELGRSIGDIVAKPLDNLAEEEDFDVENDTFYTFKPIKGSGQGVTDLAKNHDKYLYGEK